MIIPGRCNDTSESGGTDLTLTGAGAGLGVTMLLTSPEHLLTPVSGGQETQETATDRRQGWSQTLSTLIRANNSEWRRLHFYNWYLITTTIFDKGRVMLLTILRKILRKLLGTENTKYLFIRIVYWHSYCPMKTFRTIKLLAPLAWITDLHRIWPCHFIQHSYKCQSLAQLSTQRILQKVY